MTCFYITAMVVYCDDCCNIQTFTSFSHTFLTVEYTDLYNFHNKLIHTHALPSKLYTCKGISGNCTVTTFAAEILHQVYI